MKIGTSASATVIAVTATTLVSGGAASQPAALPFTTRRLIETSVVATFVSD